MTIRDIITLIAADINYTSGNNSVGLEEANRILSLMNRCINIYNTQGLLSFNYHSETPQKINGDYFVSNGIDVAALYVLCNSNKLRIKQVQLTSLYELTNSGVMPSLFSIKRNIDVNGVRMIQLFFDTKNVAYELEAVIKEDLPAFNLNDEFTLPPEYQNLLISDVQLRLLVNDDISPSSLLYIEKKREFEEVKKLIKEANFKNYDFGEYAISKFDKFNAGLFL